MAKRSGNNLPAPGGGTKTRKKKGAEHSAAPQGPVPGVADPPTSSKPGPSVPSGPTVALVGRPNVGKSSLFNALVGEQISITDARAGTTRDRVLHPLLIEEKPCELLDTGGIGIVDDQDLSALVEAQISAAIENADIFIMVVDAKEGLTPADRNIARRIRTLGRPMILAVNKSEGNEASLTVAEFSSLGIQPVIATSALHRRGLEELEQALLPHLPEKEAALPRDDDGIPRIAVVGRRNVGKSSFVNVLARAERAIVSDIPGTTRDAIDLLLEKDGVRFCLIDTAGIRRMKEPKGPVEFFAQVRSERAIRRADVVILMLAATEGVSTTDQQTGMLIEEGFKPCVLVVNKWDQAEDVTTEEYAKYLAQRLSVFRSSPICFTSAINGRRCWQTIDVALELYRQSHTQVPTPALNKALVEAERRHEPPVKKTKKPRLLYGVQVAVGPPTFVVYCRHAEKIDEKYNRYLCRFLAERFDLEEVPIRIFFRDSSRDQ